MLGIEDTHVGQMYFSQGELVGGGGRGGGGWFLVMCNSDRVHNIAH